MTQPTLSQWEVAEYLQMWDDHGIREIPPEAALLLTHALTQAETEDPPSPASGTLQSVRAELGDCQRCRLCEERTHIVFGSGNENSRLMFVGEAPGADEDATGEPFVGAAGKLLDKIIGAMNFKREDIYIANVVKCRPPENRTPLPDEIDACGPFLKSQIDQIQPEVIVALGLPAIAFLTGKSASMGTLRGKFHDLAWDCGKPVKIMATYHPAYLLRSPNAKGVVWNDMKQVMALFETGVQT